MIDPPPQKAYDSDGSDDNIVVGSSARPRRTLRGEALPPKTKKIVRPATSLYDRGPGNKPEDAQGKRRLQQTITKTERNTKTAVRRLARAELLKTDHEVGYLEAEEGEKTHTIRQDSIMHEVDVQTAKKRYDLHLPVLGPYLCDYSTNGASLVLLGALGHAACMRWKSFSLQSEVQLKERCYDVRYLHDDQLFAVAQKSYTYMYGNDGVEVHQLRPLADVRRLEFLPQHFLLCGGSTTGILTWFDVSTGTLVGLQRSRLGEVQALRRNPASNVLHVGHTNGTVTLWSPKVSQCLVKMATHRGGIVDLCIDYSGTYMATLGVDGYCRLWDLRTLQSLHQYSAMLGTTVDISYTGLLAVGTGHRIEVWKGALAAKQHKPYMAHNFENALTKTMRVRFCPYEDVLGVSHSFGFSSLLIPGAGCPTPDFFSANVYETKRQRRERPIHQLLDKLPADTIGLHTKIGTTTTHDAPKKALLRRQSEHAERKQREEGIDEKDAAGSSDNSSEASNGVIDTWEAQKKREEKLANRDKEKNRLKRERKMNKMEGTDKFKLKQRGVGRRQARLTRRKLRREKATGEAEHPTAEMGGPATNDWAESDGDDRDGNAADTRPTVNAATHRFTSSGSFVKKRSSSS